MKNIIYIIYAMYMECYRTIFLSGTEGGEVLYIQELAGQHQELTRSGVDTSKDKYGVFVTSILQH